MDEGVHSMVEFEKKVAKHRLLFAGAHFISVADLEATLKSPVDDGESQQ